MAAPISFLLRTNDMLIKMLRTQRTAFGMLHANVAYEIEAKTPDKKKSLAALLDRGFAEKTTQKALDAAKAEAEAKAGAAAEAEAQAKEEDEAKAKAEAEAKAKAADAK